MSDSSRGGVRYELMQSNLACRCPYGVELFSGWAQGARDVKTERTEVAVDRAASGHGAPSERRSGAPTRECA